MKNFILVFLACTLACHASAIRIQSGENITIYEPVHEDLYVAGGTIIINAPIYGDLIVAGGTITLNDSVAYDILLAGGTVIFNGYVGDDIRCAGGDLHISGNVRGDVVVTGGRIEIDTDATIGGSLLVAGGDVTVNGTVQGEVRSATGKLTLNGTVEKDILCKAGELEINGTIGGNAVLAAETITTGSRAAFHGDVRYWNDAGTFDFGEALKNGHAAYDPSLKMDTDRWHYLGFASVLMLLWFLGTALVMIFLIQYLFGAVFKKAAGTALNETLKSLGFGFLFLLAVPIIIVLCFITIIGVPVGLIILFAYITLLLFATSVTAVVTANWINTVYYSSAWKTGRLTLTAFGVFIVLKLLFLTPFIGPLLMVLVVCLAFGAILLNVRLRRDNATVTA